MCRELTQNMRVVGTDAKSINFNNHLMDIGNGTVPVVIKPNMITIDPPQFEFQKMTINTDNEITIRQSMNNFIDIIYPGSFLI